MAPLHRKRPRQFVSSYSFERVAVLGRTILLLSAGLHSWHALRLRSGCSGPPGYTMLYTCLPLVSTCVPLVSYSPACRDVPKQHPAALDRQRQETTTKQRERDQLQQTSTSSTCPKKRARGRQEHQSKIPQSNQRRAGKGKGPGNLSLEKRDQNQMQTRSEPWQPQTPESRIRRLNHMKQPTGKILRTLRHRRALTQHKQAEHSNSRQNPAAARRTQRKRAEPSTSRQIPAGTDSNSRGQNHTDPKYDKFQWARLSPNY